MGYYRGPNIVTDGLTLYLDAANQKSYQITSDLAIKTGCIVWFDANDQSSVTYGVNNQVTQWRDKSGNDNHVSQAASTYQPIYIPSAINGKGGVRFNGASNILLGNLKAGVNNCTMFLVVKNIATATEDLPFCIGTAGQVSMLRSFYNGGGDAFCFAGWANDLASGLSFSYGLGYTIYCIRQNGTVIGFYKNGTYTSGSVSALSTTSTALSLGGITGTDGYYNSNCEIAEAIAYDRALSDEEIRVVDSYLGNKYAITNIDKPQVWRDLSGNNNYGTIYNDISYNSGNYGNLRFLGTNSYVTTPLNLTKDNGSVNMWFKLNSLKDYNSLFDNNAGPNEWEFWVYSNGAMKFRTNSDNTDIQLNYSTIAINTWYNAQITWSISGAILYINNVKVVENTVSIGRSTPSTFFIGGGNSGNTKLDGYISLVSVYNRTLSVDEVNQNYEATKGRFNL